MHDERRSKDPRGKETAKGDLDAHVIPCAQTRQSVGLILDDQEVDCSVNRLGPCRDFVTNDHDGDIGDCLPKERLDCIAQEAFDDPVVTN